MMVTDYKFSRFNLAPPARSRRWFTPVDPTYANLLPIMREMFNIRINEFSLPNFIFGLSSCGPVLISPYFEEMLKRKFPIGGLLFMAYVECGHMRYNAFPEFLFRIYLHGVLAKCPNPEAAHYAFNAAVTFITPSVHPFLLPMGIVQSLHVGKLYWRSPGSILLGIIFSWLSHCQRHFLGFHPDSSSMPFCFPPLMDWYESLQKIDGVGLLKSAAFGPCQIPTLPHPRFPFPSIKLGNGVNFSIPAIHQFTLPPDFEPEPFTPLHVSAQASGLFDFVCATASNCKNFLSSFIPSFPFSTQSSYTSTELFPPIPSPPPFEFEFPKKVVELTFPDMSVEHLKPPVGFEKVLEQAKENFSSPTPFWDDVFSYAYKWAKPKILWCLAGAAVAGTLYLGYKLLGKWEPYRRYMRRNIEPEFRPEENFPRVLSPISNIVIIPNSDYYIPERKERAADLLAEREDILRIDPTHMLNLDCSLCHRTMLNCNCSDPRHEFRNAMSINAQKIVKIDTELDRLSNPKKLNTFRVGDILTREIDLDHLFIKSFWWKVNLTVSVVDSMVVADSRPVSEQHIAPGNCRFYVVRQNASFHINIFGFNYGRQISQSFLPLFNMPARDLVVSEDLIRGVRRGMLTGRHKSCTTALLENTLSVPLADPEFHFNKVEPLKDSLFFNRFLVTQKVPAYLSFVPPHPESSI